MMEKLDNGIVNNDNDSNSNNDSDNDNIKIDDENDDENGCSSSSCSYTYASAVQALLSSPGLHQSTTKEDIAKSARRRTRTVSDMRYYWKKIRCYHHTMSTSGTTTTNSNNEQQQQQKVLPLLIHITGTKGKGSTACLCEAILRGHGYSTGLFTSPHLLNIRERIRWNGKPIHEQIFAQVYWTIRQALECESVNDEYECNANNDGNNGATTNDDTDDDDDDDDERLPPTIPGYFRMLTLMGLYTFLYELNSSSSSSTSMTGSGVGVGVDVIILEVGMGGRYDATNFLDTTTNFRRVVHGVTLLDFDHTRILGDTLEQIAWEKGGIFATNKLNPNGTSVPPTPASTATATSSATATTTKSTPAGMVTKNDQTTEKEEEPLSSSSSSNYFMLDSNTTGVVNMMQSCARIEGNRNQNGNKNGEESEVVLVDAMGRKLKEAFVAFNNKTLVSAAGVVGKRKEEEEAEQEKETTTQRQRQAHTQQQQQQPVLLSLGLAGNHQYGNATLAVALCQAVTTTTTTTTTITDTKENSTDHPTDTENASSVSVTAAATTTPPINRRTLIDLNSAVTLQALSHATWPGRCQTLLYTNGNGNHTKGDNENANESPNDDDAEKHNNTIQFYLDGAHTPQSLAATVEWFRSKTRRSTRRSTSSTTTNNINDNGRNTDNDNNSPILVFNCSHERNPVELLELLFQLTSPSPLSSSSSKQQQQPPPPPPMIHFSRVYFAKSDSFRPSPIDPPSAESLLTERGIQIQPELVSVFDTENENENENENDHNKREEPANTTITTTTTTRTWQETLAIIWKHLVYNDNENKHENNNENKNNNCRNTIIRCNMTATEIVQEIVPLIKKQKQQQNQHQHQQQQHDERQRQRQDSNNNDDDKHHDNEHEHDHTASFPPQTVFVTGSLYLVGSFLTAVGWHEESSSSSNESN